jgi:hypothetical protein
MEILLDNIVVAPNLFCVNDGQNYGEFFNHKTKEYQVQIHKAAFIALIEIEYNQTRNEIKIDDAFENENSDFTNTNYCSLRELHNYPKDFLEIMKTYLHIDLLKKIFPSNEKNKYVINSTDSIILKDNLVLIKGRVWCLS